MKDQGQIVAPSKRRIFLKSNDKTRQIFSFTQRNDGSIYCSSPDLSDAKYISCKVEKGRVSVLTTQDVGEGKISLHGSGLTLVRPHNDTKGHRLVIEGNHLLNEDKKNAGVRHLFTVFVYSFYERAFL